MLEGKIFTVTGAGSGIGEGAAKVLVHYGASVALCDVDLAAVTRVADEIKAAGGTATAETVDISNDDQVAQFFDNAVKKFGRIDGAFNNVGIPGPQGPAVDAAAAGWNRVFAVNMTGTWNCLRHEIRALRAGGNGGSIVNNASNGGLTGVKNMAPYAATKAGVINLTYSLAVEHGPENIRVNAICPGTILTPSVIKLKTEGGRDFTSEMTHRTPLGRLGTPEDIGELVAWLLSSRSSYITGQAISVDGGMSSTFL